VKIGYIHLYTGNGKGKTTAAFGVVLRMLGAGGKVFIGQFLKKGDYSEIKAFKRWGESIEIEQFGSGRFIVGEADKTEKALAQSGFERCRSAVVSGKYDLVVMDEVTLALSMGLIEEKSLLELLDDKHEAVEIILTGRNASPVLIDKADLVTEMIEVKHYFQRGVKARIGIEE